MLLAIFISVIIPVLSPIFISRAISEHVDVVNNNASFTNQFYIKSSIIDSPPFSNKDMEFMLKARSVNTASQLKETKRLILASGLFALFNASVPLIVDAAPFSFNIAEMSLISGMNYFTSFFLTLLTLFFAFCHLLIRYELIKFISELNDSSPEDRAMLDSLIKQLPADKRDLGNKASSYINAVFSQKRLLTKGEVIRISELLTQIKINNNRNITFLP